MNQVRLLRASDVGRAHLRATGGTIQRVLQQVVRDRRSTAMVVLLPVLLLTLLYFMLQNVPAAAEGTRIFDRLAPAMVGFFPFFIMFIIASITMLRERQSGTLERALSTASHRIDLLLGYAAAFTLLAVVQVSLMLVVGFVWLQIAVASSLWWLYVAAIAGALLGVGLGLLLSASARTEFQVMQLVPGFIVPQVLLCGLFVPREQMAGWLEAISHVLPLTYVVRAVNEVARQPVVTSTLLWSLLVVLVLALGSLAGAAATLRHRR